MMLVRRRTGFTLIELLVVIAIMGFVLAVAGQMAMGMLRAYKQQGRAAESNIEGILGLETMRRDLDNAGYGLPWDLNGFGYAEAMDGLAQPYNDTLAGSVPPRAIVTGDNVAAAGIVAGSDYLAIKAVNVARNETCNKWGYLSIIPPFIKGWGSAEADLVPTDRVTVIDPGTSETSPQRILINPATTTAAAPADALLDVTRLVYGVDPNTPLRMPFNRADYYVSTTMNSPGRCAPGTGTLVKSVVNHADGLFTNTISPVLDCVADMQIVWVGGVGCNPAAPPASTTNSAGIMPIGPGVCPTGALDVRNQLQELRIYILAQEGARDPSYMHQVNPILVGDTPALGRNYDLTPIPNGRNYRWKIYTLVVRPTLMR